MLLSDTDIRMHLKSDEEELVLRIEPLNQQDIQPASIDLHLGKKLLVMRGPYWWGSRPFSDQFEEHDLEEKPVLVMPGDFILGHTFEWIEIPPTLAGEMIGKSSRAREGWHVEAAGYFDPGWKGRGTLEITMRHPLGGTLTYEMGICQMRFHVMSSRPTYLYGQQVLKSHYFGAESVEPSFTDRRAPTPVAPSSTSALASPIAPA